MADKQNLADTFKMGQFLLDLVSGITINTVYSYLPLRIPIRAGLVKNNEIILNGGTREKTSNWISTPKVKWSKLQRLKLFKSFEKQIASH